jgi:hypothetical protein
MYCTLRFAYDHVRYFFKKTVNRYSEEGKPIAFGILLSGRSAKVVCIGRKAKGKMLQRDKLSVRTIFDMELINLDAVLRWQSTCWRIREYLIELYGSMMKECLGMDAAPLWDQFRKADPRDEDSLTESSSNKEPEEEHKWKDKKVKAKGNDGQKNKGKTSRQSAFVVQEVLHKVMR